MDEEVVSDGKAGMSRALICALATDPVGDMVVAHGHCHKCNVAVVFSVNAPRDVPRICLKCATHEGIVTVDRGGNVEPADGVKIVTTEKLADELTKIIETKFGPGGKA